MNPRSRKDKLLSRQLDDDLLIYDVERYKAHCLNPTAALVFSLCDGERSEDELAKAVGERLGVDDPQPLVQLALAQLDRARLLERSGPARPPSGVSRRRLLQGAAAVLLPAITSLMAPEAASAGSSITNAVCAGRMHPNCSMGISKCFPTTQFCRRVMGTMNCSCQ